MCVDFSVRYASMHKLVDGRCGTQQNIIINSRPNTKHMFTNGSASTKKKMLRYYEFTYAYICLPRLIMQFDSCFFVINKKEKKIVKIWIVDDMWHAAQFGSLVNLIDRVIGAVSTQRMNLKKIYILSPRTIHNPGGVESTVDFISFLFFSVNLFALNRVHRTQTQLPTAFFETMVVVVVVAPVRQFAMFLQEFYMKSN